MTEALVDQTCIRCGWPFARRRWTLLTMGGIPFEHVETWCGNCGLEHHTHRGVTGAHEHLDRCRQAADALEAALLRLDSAENAMREVVSHLQRSQRGSTHWAGCPDVHPVCQAIDMLVDALESRDVETPDAGDALRRVLNDPEAMERVMDRATEAQRETLRAVETQGNLVTSQPKRCEFCDPDGMPPRLHTPTGNGAEG